MRRSRNHRATERLFVAWLVAIPFVAHALWPFGDAAAPARPRIAVTRFEVPANLVVPLIERVETTFLHDGTIGALVRGDVVDVVERTRMDAVGTELGLTKAGLTDPAQAARIGKLVGASHVLVGTLATVELRRDRRPIPYTTRFEDGLRGRIRLEYRVVEAESGRVAGADSVDVRDELWASDAGDAVAPFWEQLQRTAAEAIAVRVLDVAAPLRVVAVDGGRVELSRGTTSGVAAGLVCDVLDARHDPVARVTVSEAAATHASGRIEGDAAGVAPDMPCRPRAAAPPEPPAAAHDPTEGRW